MIKNIFSRIQTTLQHRAFLHFYFLSISLLITAFFSLDILDGCFILSFFQNSDTNMVFNFSFLGVYLILYSFSKYLFKKTSTKETIIHIFLSTVFSTLSISGVFFENQPCNVRFSSPSSVLSVTVAFLGGYFLFFYTFHLLRCLGRSLSRHTEIKEQGFWAVFFGKHCFIHVFCVVLLCWLPKFILFFPGTMYYDSWRCIAMFFHYPDLQDGTLGLTNIHPLIWSVPMGLLTKLGLHIGISWLASFFISVVHHVAAALLTAYTIVTMKKFKFHLRFLIAVLCFYIFHPVIIMFSSTIQNDFLYSLSIQLLTLECFIYLYDPFSFSQEKRHFPLTALGVFGTILRYNGFYTVLIFIVFFALREAWSFLKKKSKPSLSIALILVMLFSLFCGQFVQKALEHSYDATIMNSRVKNAMLIQQATRCLILHGTDIPEDIYNDLHGVLLWSDEKLKENYNPLNFDGVKFCFDYDAPKEKLDAFHSAWLKLFFLYPKDCIAATMHQNYFLFSPLTKNNRYLFSASQHKNHMWERYLLNVHDYLPDNYENSAYERQLFSDFFYNEYVNFPIMNLLDNQAVYTILLMFIAFSFLIFKTKKGLCLTVMPFITLLITVAGPAVYLHARYTFPVMFCMPILFAAFILEHKNESVPT